MLFQCNFFHVNNNNNKIGEINNNFVRLCLTSDSEYFGCESVTDQVLIKEYNSFYARLPINQSTACDQASFDFVSKKEGSIIEKQCLKSSAMPYACELSQSFIKTLFQSDSTDDANLTPIRIEFHYTCGFYSKYIINKIFFC